MARNNFAEEYAREMECRRQFDAAEAAGNTEGQEAARDAYRRLEEQIAEKGKAYGIEKFTFSSSWSSAVETAWLFTQNGCRLERIVEINGSHKAFMSDEYEKAHGYLFSIGEK